jgi:hypothetical protein
MEGEKGGGTRRKHMSKTVKMLRNGRKINNPCKEDVDKHNLIKILT